jgi:hypothetical protein
MNLLFGDTNQALGKSGFSFVSGDFLGDYQLLTNHPHSFSGNNRMKM